MSQLLTVGYQMVTGPLAADEIPGAARVNDKVLETLEQDKIKRGSTSIRFGGLAAVQPFHRIYTHKPVLELAQKRLGAAAKLSFFCGRTLLPNVSAPPLHQDVKPGSDGDPLVAFIFMLDDFTLDNGATRFLPGSQGAIKPPPDVSEVQICGSAGSMIVFDATIWHEHGPNFTVKPRRSIQGYFVRQDRAPAICWRDELSQDQAAKLPKEARDLLHL